MIRKFHLAKLAMQGDFKGTKQGEFIYGPIPLDIKQAIFLNPDFSNFLDGYKPSSDQFFPPNFSPKVVLWGTGQAP